MRFFMFVIFFLSVTKPLLAQESDGPNPLKLDIQPAQNKETRAHRLEWSWRRVHWGEITSSIALGLGTLAINQTKEASRNWTGGILFDDWVRDALRVKGNTQKRIIRASNILEFSLIGAPTLIDTLGVTLIGDRNLDVAGQLFAIQGQAFAMTGFLTVATKTVVGRQRPEAKEQGCGDNGIECGAGANRSFFSGHAAFAFTGAGLICVEHTHLPLFGRIGGKLACGTALTAASAASIFRILGDKHWATDVLVGAGVGLWSGWLMPWILHYRHPQPEERARWRRHLGKLTPYGQKNGFGLGYQSTF